jgi:hypothetical protein
MLRSLRIAMTILQWLTYPLTSPRTKLSKSVLPGRTETDGSSWRKNQRTVQVEVAPGATLT